MADYQRSEILSTEDYTTLDFTQEEFYLYQKFFKSNSPLVLYFANRKKQLTASQLLKLANRCFQQWMQKLYNLLVFFVRLPQL